MKESELSFGTVFSYSNTTGIGRVKYYVDGEELTATFSDDGYAELRRSNQDHVSWQQIQAIFRKEPSDTIVFATDEVSHDEEGQVGKLSNWADKDQAERALQMANSVVYMFYSYKHGQEWVGHITPAGDRFNGTGRFPKEFDPKETAIQKFNFQDDVRHGHYIPLDRKEQKSLWNRIRDKNDISRII